MSNIRRHPVYVIQHIYIYISHTIINTTTTINSNNNNNDNNDRNDNEIIITCYILDTKYLTQIYDLFATFAINLSKI